MKKAIVLLFLIVLTITGCGINKGANPSTMQLSMKDKTYIVPKNPQRVVLLTSNLTEMWLEAGGEKQLAGCPKSDNLQADIKNRIPKTAIDIGVTNLQSMEKVVEANPDLVIGLAGYKYSDRSKNVMQSSKIPYIEVNCELLEDNINAVRLFGKLTGQEERVEKIITNITRQLEEIKNSLHNKPKKKVLAIYGTPSNILVVTDKGRYGEILRLAGADNIAPASNKKSAYIPISLEYIAEQNPDIILFFCYGNAEKTKEKLQSTFVANPTWAGLKATKNNAVHFVNGKDVPINPGLNTVKVVAKLQKLIYAD